MTLRRDSEGGHLSWTSDHYCGSDRIDSDEAAALALTRIAATQENIAYSLKRMALAYVADADRRLAEEQASASVPERDQ